MSVLVGKKAPQFTAKAVINGEEIINEFSLNQYLGKKSVVFFFYPKDFTSVCPKELHAFQDNLNAFEKRNVAVVACSTDTEQSHMAWLQMPAKQGGIQGIKYPIVADTNKTISAAFDVLNGQYFSDEDGNLKANSEMIALRGLFLIDKKGIIQHQVINNMHLARSVSETLRMVDAIQFNEENGEVCPANWMSEKDGMNESHDGVSNSLSAQKMTSN